MQASLGIIPMRDAAAEPAAGPSRDVGNLLLRHRKGDGEAFAALVAEYRRPVYSYLCRCGIPEADRDDVFQTVFLKIHRSAHQYRPDRPPHPWIFTIVANEVRSHLRRRRVRDLLFSESAAREPEDPAPDGERLARARERVRFLEEQIRRLPLPQREVLVLATIESLPLKDVAEALGVPLNTVKTHLRRARLTLSRRLLEHEGGGGAQPGGRTS